MTQQDNNYKINNPEAKEQVERKAEHLDTILEQGNQIEKETQGENPDWKAVKDLHAGKAPVDKILFRKEVPAEEVKQEPEQKTPEKEVPQTPQPEIKKDEPETTPEPIKEQPLSQPEPIQKKERDDGRDKWKGYTDRI